jgi:hypothetical protein
LAIRCTKSILLCFACALFACSQSPSSEPAGQGGTPSNPSGGSTTGGSVASGIGGASGGIASATGGSQATGGVSSGGNVSGGSSSSGGATAGSSSGGSVSSTGGSMPIAGAATGGNATGGSTTGGSTTGGSTSGGGSGGTSAGTANSPLLVPMQGALFGAFVGTGTMAQLETTLGRKTAIQHDFHGWTDDWMVSVRSTLSAGKIPLITWEAWTNGSVGTSLDDIISGVHDTLIRTRAEASKDAGQKFFLRWGHEMNGNWYPWDGFHNGANAAAATKYIAAYRHIHDVFTGAGASNVLWVFSPNADSVPGDAWNQWANYYPGDSYVDWLGYDGYNWGTASTGSTWRSFQAIGSSIYPSLAAKGKPLMIPETACAEVGGDKAAWINALLPTLRQSFPAIKALVWFHMNKETDWRVDSSSAAKSAFVPFATDAYMNP